MKKTFILMILVLIALPAFSQGTIESLKENGIVGTYKKLINYGEEEVVTPVEEEVVTTLEETESEDISAEEEIVDSLVEENTLAREIPTSLPVDGVETPGFTYLTNIFPQLAEEEIYELSYSYSGIKIGGVFTFDTAVIIIPRGMTGDSINIFASEFVEKYPEYSSVVFTSEVDKLVLTYPLMTMDEVVSFADTLLHEAEKLVDRMILSRSRFDSVAAETEEENSQVVAAQEESGLDSIDYNSDLDVNIPLSGDEKGAFTNFDDILLDLSNRKTIVYEVNFAHNGITTRGIFTENTAVLLIPRGISAASIDRFAQYLLENYDGFSSVYFSNDFDKIYLYYPAKSEGEIIEFCNIISSEAEKFLDTIYSRRSQSENAVITTTSDSVYEEKESVATPVAVENTKSSIFSFSCGFDLGFKGLFSASDDEAKFFPTIGGDVRLDVYKFIFLESGANAMIYKSSGKLVINGALNAVGGVSLMGRNFGVFAYCGGCYLITTENSAFTKGLSLIYGVGLEVDFISHIAIKAGYEHFDDKNFYNISVGYRF